MEPLFFLTKDHSTLLSSNVVSLVMVAMIGVESAIKFCFLKHSNDNIRERFVWQTAALKMLMHARITCKSSFLSCMILTQSYELFKCIVEY